MASWIELQVRGDGGWAGTELGEAVLARAVPAYRAALGSRLTAGYALGSLAHGASARWSATSTWGSS